MPPPPRCVTRLPSGNKNSNDGSAETAAAQRAACLRVARAFRPWKPATHRKKSELRCKLLLCAMACLPAYCSVRASSCRRRVWRKYSDTPASELTSVRPLLQSCREDANSCNSPINCDLFELELPDESIAPGGAVNQYSVVTPRRYARSYHL